MCQLGSCGLMYESLSSKSDRKTKKDPSNVDLFSSLAFPVAYKRNSNMFPCNGSDITVVTSVNVKHFNSAQRTFAKRKKKTNAIFLMLTVWN